MNPLGWDLQPEYSLNVKTRDLRFVLFQNSILKNSNEYKFETGNSFTIDFLALSGDILNVLALTENVFTREYAIRSDGYITGTDLIGRSFEVDTNNILLFVNNVYVDESAYTVTDKNIRFHFKGEKDSDGNNRGYIDWNVGDAVTFISTRGINNFNVCHFQSYSESEIDPEATYEVSSINGNYFKNKDDKVLKPNRYRTLVLVNGKIIKQKELSYGQNILINKKVSLTDNLIVVYFSEDLNSYEYYPSSGQTEFGEVDANGNVLSYSPEDGAGTATLFTIDYNKKTKTDETNYYQWNVISGIRTGYFLVCIYYDDDGEEQYSVAKITDISINKKTVAVELLNDFTQETFEEGSWYLEVAASKSLTSYLDKRTAETLTFPEIFDSYQNFFLDHYQDGLARMTKIRNADEIDPDLITNTLDMLGMRLLTTSLPLENRRRAIREVINLYKRLGTRNSIGFLGFINNKDFGVQDSLWTNDYINFYTPEELGATYTKKYFFDYTDYLYIGTRAKSSEDYMPVLTVIDKFVVNQDSTTFTVPYGSFVYYPKGIEGSWKSIPYELSIDTNEFVFEKGAGDYYLVVMEDNVNTELALVSEIPNITDTSSGDLPTYYFDMNTKQIIYKLNKYAIVSAPLAKIHITAYDIADIVSVYNIYPQIDSTIIVPNYSTFYYTTIDADRVIAEKVITKTGCELVTAEDIYKELSLDFNLVYKTKIISYSLDFFKQNSINLGSMISHLVSNHNAYASYLASKDTSAKQIIYEDFKDLLLEEDWKDSTTYLTFMSNNSNGSNKDNFVGTHAKIVEAYKYTNNGLTPDINNKSVWCKIYNDGDGTYTKWFVYDNKCSYGEVETDENGTFLKDSIGMIRASFEDEDAWYTAGDIQSVISLPDITNIGTLKSLSDHQVYLCNNCVYTLNKVVSQRLKRMVTTTREGEEVDIEVVYVTVPREDYSLPDQNKYYRFVDEPETTYHEVTSEDIFKYELEDDYSQSAYYEATRLFISNSSQENFMPYVNGDVYYDDIDKTWYCYSNTVWENYNVAATAKITTNYLTIKDVLIYDHFKYMNQAQACVMTYDPNEEEDSAIKISAFASDLGYITDKIKKEAVMVRDFNPPETFYPTNHILLVNEINGVEDNLEEENFVRYQFYELNSTPLVLHAIINVVKFDPLVFNLGTICYTELSTPFFMQPNYQRIFLKTRTTGGRFIVTNNSDKDIFIHRSNRTVYGEGWVIYDAQQIEQEGIYLSYYVEHGKHYPYQEPVTKENFEQFTLVEGFDDIVRYLGIINIDYVDYAFYIDSDFKAYTEPLRNYNWVHPGETTELDIQDIMWAEANSDINVVMYQDNYRTFETNYHVPSMYQDVLFDYMKETVLLIIKTTSQNIQPDDTIIVYVNGRKYQEVEHTGDIFYIPVKLQVGESDEYKGHVKIVQNGTSVYETDLHLYYKDFILRDVEFFDKLNYDNLLVSPADSTTQIRVELEYSQYSEVELQYTSLIDNMYTEVQVLDTATDLLTEYRTKIILENSEETNRYVYDIERKITKHYYDETGRELTEAEVRALYNIEDILGDFSIPIKCYILDTELRNIKNQVTFTGPTRDSILYVNGEAYTGIYQAVHTFGDHIVAYAENKYYWPATDAQTEDFYVRCDVNTELKLTPRRYKLEVISDPTDMEVYLNEFDNTDESIWKLEQSINIIAQAPFYEPISLFIKMTDDRDKFIEYTDNWRDNYWAPGAPTDPTTGKPIYDPETTEYSRYYLVMEYMKVDGTIIRFGLNNVKKHSANKYELFNLMDKNIKSVTILYDELENFIGLRIELSPNTLKDIF